MRRWLYLLTMLLALSAALAWSTQKIWNWESYVLPDAITVDRVLASSSQSGFREGCSIALYVLSDKTIAELKAQGVAYLQNSQRNMIEGASPEWAETPWKFGFGSEREKGDSRPHVYALGATSGCAASHWDEQRKFRSDEIEEALTKSGSFYWVNSNREGLIVIVPRLKLVAYYYFG